MHVRLQPGPFDIGEITDGFAAGHLQTGGVVTFTGIVRDLDNCDMQAMEIEHYPGMTLKALENIAQDAKIRWSLQDVLIIHRYGRLAPGERIMMVATAARHRSDAFEAAAFLMDYLKSRAPFWKKEIRMDGHADWVSARPEDEAALAKWQQKSQ